MTQPRFSEENRKMFDKHVRFFEHADYWRSDEEEAVKFLKKGKLLVGGIGGGRTVQPLLKHGFSITGLDISPEMVAACKKRFPDLDIRVGDLQKTEFPDESFDSIFLPFHTICYVDDITHTLEEMRRILKPGGKMVFTMVNQWYIRSILNGTAFSPKRHAEHFGKESSDELSTIHASMFDAYAFRKVFGSAFVRGRVSLQNLQRPNWKDRLFSWLPFFDKSLYFFVTKPDTV
jgi:SAM-dependent methyltransferase